MHKLATRVYCFHGIFCRFGKKEGLGVPEKRNLEDDEEEEDARCY